MCTSMCIAIIFNAVYSRLTRAATKSLSLISRCYNCTPFFLASDVPGPEWRRRLWTGFERAAEMEGSGGKGTERFGDNIPMYWITRSATESFWPTSVDCRLEAGDPIRRLLLSVTLSAVLLIFRTAINNPSSEWKKKNHAIFL